ncbi:VOC family protein [Sinorhizobium numidicum]|uniref:VOC family protein n=1 Tax=Sinorhizobium numidicum TaxID=680248 RepID=A0ABY8D2F6_9HYPH|nr:VOC family protein [Sinorhizobium numidicum]WEX77208.1 VOC family protein [Sinorhizobium numidicum]WEX83867.1 VOC family protein [Sinorhizobium numidicum]
MTSEGKIPPIQVHLCVNGGLAAIAFYEKAFGAVNTFHQMAEDGKRVMHANLALFSGEIMLHDEFPEFGMSIKSPHTAGGASVAININLPKPEEVDSAYAKAVAAGASTVMEPQDTFWEARYARIEDPFGHIWAFNAPVAKS